MKSSLILGYPNRFLTMAGDFKEAQFGRETAGIGNTVLQRRLTC